MSALMSAEGMRAVNMMPLWEVIRDYEDLGIYYVCADGQATEIGTEDWED